MKHTTRFWWTVAAAIFVTVTFFASDRAKDQANAQDQNGERSKDREIVTLPAGETVNRDYFAFGERVEISGTVNGDVYVAGGQVLVDGKVNGDLLAAGGTISISGTVSQDARVAGGRITISGDIGRNLTVGGGNVELTDSARIARSLVIGAGNVTLAAPVRGDVTAAAGNLTVLDRINGSLRAAAGNIRLTSRAVVDGNLTYWSNHPASIDPSAKVGGRIIRKTPREISRTSALKIVGVIGGLILLAKIISFISTLILGLLFIYFFPRYTQATVSAIRNRPLASLGAGFLALVVTPVVVIVLLVSVVGIPLALILAAALFIGIYLARLWVLIWTGRSLFEWFGREARPGWALVVGLIIYFFLTLIPLVGGLVTLVVILLGAGAALLSMREPYSAEKIEDIV
jgi:cytoskeletal protein CcmA (bactofilin family)